jgi:acyl carrier protein
MRDTILAALTGIAPEVDTTALDGGTDLRDQIELDSMDYLNFMEAIAAATGVEVPERDYPKVAALDDLAAYVDARAAARS